METLTEMVCRLNIARFSELLRRPADETQRRLLGKLLTEEKAKQSAARAEVQTSAG